MNVAWLAIEFVSNGPEEREGFHGVGRMNDGSPDPTGDVPD
jgi:hypothetical protein